MTRATQLEIDFVRWLGELSADVPEKYGRWLETPDGDSDDNEYCADCAAIVAAENKASGDPFTEIDGWDDAPESDHSPSCERCGVQLRCSPTRYSIEGDIEMLPEIKEMTPDEAWTFHNWLSGMGDYDREELWPQIAEHAARLMAVAQVEVVPDGFVTFCPADVLQNKNWFNTDSIWLSVYQHFAKKLVEWMGDDNDRYEILRVTSAIHHTSFEGFAEQRQAHKCLRHLFRHVGFDDCRGRFLASLGLNSLDDLDRKIQIRDERFDWPTFDARGRIIKGSPNPSHPDARTVTNAVLQLSSDAKLWSYRLHYDYTHYDRSSWYIAKSQGKDESLRAFIESIPAWMGEVLEPASDDDQWRSDRLKKWDTCRAALRDVLYFAEPEDDIILADVLHSRDYGAVLRDGRIRIDRKRLAVLKRWIAADIQAAAERDSRFHTKGGATMTMPDLNRTPADMADALRLVEELRDEIRRRPKVVAFDFDGKTPQIRESRGYFELEAAKTYTVEIEDSRGRKVTLAQAVCVATPEASVKSVKYDTVALDGGSYAAIRCTEIKSRQFPPDIVAIQLAVRYGGLMLDPTKFMMVMPPISDQGKRLVAAELHAVAERITDNLPVGA